MKRLLIAGRIPPGARSVWELRLPQPRPGTDPPELARAQGGDVAARARPDVVVIPLRTGSGSGG